MFGKDRPVTTERLVVVSEVPLALVNERRPERERLVPVAFEKVRLVWLALVEVSEVPLAVKNEKTLVLMLVEVREVPVAFKNEIPNEP